MTVRPIRAGRAKLHGRRARLGAIGGFSVDCRLATAGEVIVGVDCADGNHYAASLVVVACGAWSTGLLEAVGSTCRYAGVRCRCCCPTVAPPLLGRRHASDEISR